LSKKKNNVKRDASSADNSRRELSKDDLGFLRRPIGPSRLSPFGGSDPLQASLATGNSPKQI